MVSSAGKEYAAQDSGNFTIATTHTQARYALPNGAGVYAKVSKGALSLLQGNPKQIAEWSCVIRPIVIATESISGFDGLISLPCYQWEHVVIVPASILC
jgi:LysR family cys regulon transcriptional activator